ncbi:MAG TPA: thioredoxin TrxC [Blastocatellia bacterium]|nr:thioredoxin TrxC [Blastocatellia bacterium]
MSATSDVQLIRCPSCGVTNRVPRERLQSGAHPVCGRCKTKLTAAAQPVVVTDANFAQEVEASPQPVLLDLWAAWCGPCHTIAPVIEQLATEMAGRVKVAKLNVDDSPQTAARFGVRSIPTLLILKNGREVDRLVGALPKQEILRHLQAVI